MPDLAELIAGSGRYEVRDPGALTALLRLRQGLGLSARVHIPAPLAERALRRALTTQKSAG